MNTNIEAVENELYLRGFSPEKLNTYKNYISKYLRTKPNNILDFVIILKKQHYTKAEINSALLALKFYYKNFKRKDITEITKEIKKEENLHLSQEEIEDIIKDPLLIESVPTLTTHD